MECSWTGSSKRLIQETLAQASPLDVFLRGINFLGQWPKIPQNKLTSLIYNLNIQFLSSHADVRMNE